MICCPYCGNEEFYVKQKTNGPANYYYRFDVEQDNNGGVNDSILFELVSSFAYCANCRMKLFKLKEQKEAYAPWLLCRLKEFGENDII